MEQNFKKGNGVVGFIVIVALIWGGYSLFSEDNSRTTYDTDNITDSDDGYTWAEENDISSFDECQDQFGTSYEEDECNRYVQENYSGYNTFRGNDCTEDCSGHEAGYNWAEENDISDEYDCDGNSNSFNEGCVSYVEENY
jgi:hypothetical protein